MTAGLQSIVCPVTDLVKAKAFYGALLGEPTADMPCYGGYRAAGQDIGLDPNGAKMGMATPVGYWDVEDIEKQIAALVAAGTVVQDEPRDVGGGRLIASLVDADGNPVGLRQP